MPRQRLPTADPQPTAPGSLLGVSEVAELAGISRQRAHVLTRRAGFPAPVVALKMGLVWRAVPVERWLAEYEKRKGTSPGAGGASPP
jgi:predicted DNA-binding transcriptional regulator AlpA